MTTVVPSLNKENIQYSVTKLLEYSNKQSYALGAASVFPEVIEVPRILDMEKNRLSAEKQIQDIVAALVDKVNNLAEIINEQ